MHVNMKAVGLKHGVHQPDKGNLSQEFPASHETLGNGRRREPVDQGSQVGTSKPMLEVAGLTPRKANDSAQASRGRDSTCVSTCLAVK